MKLLLVLASDRTFSTISHILSEKGFALIRYRHILKAMDNIDEIDPAGIIISAQDFPRHWKIIVQFVRAERVKDQCPIVVLCGDGFSGEETGKAEHIGVNGIFAEALVSSADLKKLESLLCLPKKAPPVKTGIQLSASGAASLPEGRFGFMFSNPQSEKIITGMVTAVSSSGLSMEVDCPALIKDLKAGMKIPGCSLKAGDAILSPACVLRRTTYGGAISLEWENFPEADKAALEACLEI